MKYNTDICLNIVYILNGNSFTNVDKGCYE